MAISIKPYYGLDFFLVTAPISVSTIIFGKLDIIILLCSVLLAIGFINWQSYRFSVQLKWIVMLFYGPFLLSFCWSFLLIPFINDQFYYSFVSSDLFSRVFHVLLYLIILLYADGIIRQSTPFLIQKFLYTYACGVLIIFGLFGIWQIMGNILGIWVPDVQTRSTMYFARGLGFGRVTSLADEPSYLAPFLIDAILIFIFLRHNIEAILLSIVLLFSFSFGGLMESIVLISYYFFIASKNSKIKIISVALTVIGIILIIFPQIIEIITTLISSRAELQSGFDPSQTSRTQGLVFPIFKWTEFDFISIFIGHGPASSKYLLNSNPNDALFSTSNNIYVDLLYEEGLIGVFCFIILLCLFWKYSKSFFSRSQVLFRIFLIHIVLSSLYRADYAGARYTVIFIIILAFCYLNSYFTNIKGCRLRI